MMKPRVSVLMPVFNGARYVEAACESILRQTEADLELVVLDDGSTDDTSRRLGRLASRDARMVLVARENRGLIASRNELVGYAKAPLIAWMDADDVSRPERMATQAAAFDADPSLVCLGSAVLEVDPDGEPLGVEVYPAEHEGILRNMLKGGAMRFPATMMRTEAVAKAGAFREPFKVGEDLDLFLRLSEIGRLANLADVLLDYRQHPKNTSRVLGLRWPVYRDAILALAAERTGGGRDRLQKGEQLVLTFPDIAETERPAWESHLGWARQALMGGHPEVAKKHAWKALRLNPAKLASWRLAGEAWWRERGSRERRGLLA